MTRAGATRPYNTHPMEMEKVFAPSAYEAKWQRLWRERAFYPVSYTHLTLPTILRV